MEKPLLMTHPDVPCTVVGEGKDDSVRYGRYGDKAIGLEKGNPALRPNPQLPVSVLKEGLRLVRQPALCCGASAHAGQTSIAIHRDLARCPSIQPIRGAQPETAIPRGQNGKNPSARETLLVGKRWDCKVAKPVQAVPGRHPNIVFPILKQRGHGPS